MNKSAWIYFNMISIRTYKSKDFADVQKLIAKTFEKTNPCHGSKKDVQKFVDSLKTETFEQRFKESPICFVALAKNKIVGVVRGDEDRLRNLFVDTRFFKKGIARKLYEKYEKKARQLGYTQIKLYSSIDAVGFYQKVGFKKTRGPSKKGTLQVQHMKKKI